MADYYALSVLFWFFFIISNSELKVLIENQLEIYLARIETE